MTLTVYLSNDVRDVLLCYGPLDEVVNKILIAGSQGVIDIMQKPAAPEKKDGSYHAINIREPDYIALVETYGAKSSKVSLRRLLYWFVENEVYEELGWEPDSEFVELKQNKRYDSIVKLKQALYNAKKYLPELSDTIEEFRTRINEVEDETWYAS